MPLASVSNFIGDGIWVAGSVFTNPTDQTVLVDTGAITNKGNYLFAVSGAGSVAWIYDIQRRDNVNNTNIHSQRRRPAPGNDDIIIANKIAIATNERVRVVLQGT